MYGPAMSSLTGLAWDYYDGHQDQVRWKRLYKARKVNIHHGARESIQGIGKTL